MKLSYSSISTYRNCPLSYKFIYVDRLPRKKTPALSFGSTIHKTLYYFYNVPTPKPPSLEGLLNFLNKNWLSEGYSSEGEEKTYREFAKQILRNFYRTNVDNFSLPVALEHKFQIKLDGNLSSGEPCFLTGIIDKVEKTPNGNLEIIDYKTSRKLPPQSIIDKDLQLSMYYFAAKNAWSIEPEKLTLYFVVPNIRMSTIRKAEELPIIEELILQTAENIKAGNFEPTQNNLCPWCAFQARCPFFKDKFKKTEESMEIEKTIDEYANLNGQKKLITSRLEKIKDILHQYFEEHNLKQIFSQANAIALSERTKYIYDTEKVKDILEPLNLWEKIVQIDNKSLKNLLDSNALDEKTKKLIEETKELQNTSYSLCLKTIKKKDGE